MIVKIFLKFLHIFILICGEFCNLPLPVYHQLCQVEYTDCLGPVFFPILSIASKNRNLFPHEGLIILQWKEGCFYLPLQLQKKEIYFLLDSCLFCAKMNVVFTSLFSIENGMNFPWGSCLFCYQTDGYF